MRLGIFLWGIVVRGFSRFLGLGCCFGFRLTCVCPGFLFADAGCIRGSLFAFLLASKRRGLGFLMAIMGCIRGMGFSSFIIMLLSGFSTLKILSLIFYSYQIKYQAYIWMIQASKLSP